MLKVSVRSLFILLYLLFSVESCTNMDYQTKTVGAFKNTGAGKSFVILNISDIGKHALKLENAWIIVHLYNGFAAVKEEYSVINTTGQNLSLQMGVPVSGYYHNDVIDTVKFGNWSHPEISINGNKITHMQVDTNQKITIPGMEVTGDKWNTWKFTFPKDTSRIITHYLVKTHGSHVRDGYDIEYTDGFTYLLKPLLQWNTQIHKIRVLFVVDKSSVRMKWIDGILPAGRFKLKDHTFVYDMENVRANTLSNIIFRYGKPDMYAPKDGFSFSSMASDTTEWYQQINKTGIWNIDTTGYKKFARAEFKPAPMGFFSISGIVIVFLLLGVSFLVLLFWGAYSQYRNTGKR